MCAFPGKSRVTASSLRSDASGRSRPRLRRAARPRRSQAPRASGARCGRARRARGDAAARGSFDLSSRRHRCRRGNRPPGGAPASAGPRASRLMAASTPRACRASAAGAASPSRAAARPRPAPPPPAAAGVATRRRRKPAARWLGGGPFSLRCWRDAESVEARPRPRARARRRRRVPGVHCFARVSARRCALAQCGGRSHHVDGPNFGFISRRAEPSLIPGQAKWSRIARLDARARDFHRLQPEGESEVDMAEDERHGDYCALRGDGGVHVRVATARAPQRLGEVKRSACANVARAFGDSARARSSRSTRPSGALSAREARALLAARERRARRRRPADPRRWTFGVDGGGSCNGVATTRSSWAATRGARSRARAIGPTRPPAGAARGRVARGRRARRAQQWPPRARRRGGSRARPRAPRSSRRRARRRSARRAAVAAALARVADEPPRDSSCAPRSPPSPPRPSRSRGPSSARCSRRSASPSTPTISPRSSPRCVAATAASRSRRARRRRGSRLQRRRRARVLPTTSRRLQHTAAAATTARGADLLAARFATTGARARAGRCTPRAPAFCAGWGASGAPPRARSPRARARPASERGRRGPPLPPNTSSATTRPRRALFAAWNAGGGSRRRTDGRGGASMPSRARCSSRSAA